MPTILIMIIFSFSLFGDTLVFGVLEYKGKEKVIKQYEPLAKHIEKQLHIPVELQVLPQEILEKQILQKKIDIVATNPTHFIALRANGNLTGAIATEIKSYNGVETSYLGGVIITRSDRPDIRSLHDLQYHSVAYPGKKFLGGWQAQKYELAKAGISLNEKLLFEVKKHERVVENVLSKKVDAGFIRTGILEEMIADGRIKRSDVFIINEQDIDHFPWIVSTSLYPEWAIAARTDLGSVLIKKIAASIYTYTPNSGQKEGRIGGFTIPADYTNVDSLARELRLPPYEKAPHFTLSDIWNAYDKTIIGLLISFIINVFLIIFLYRSLQKLKRNKRELAHSATHDPLTNLYNRRGMGEMASYIIGSLKRNLTYAAIIYIDLDNFKPLNDTYGHVMGDTILKEVAYRLISSVRASDIVSRMGGDEFVILLSNLGNDKNTSEQSALATAEKIRLILQEPYHFATEAGKQTISSISASIGVIIFDHTSDVERLISSADKAMYQAKENGRNQVINYCLEKQGKLHRERAM